MKRVDQEGMLAIVGVVIIAISFIGILPFYKVILLGMGLAIVFGTIISSR